MSHPQKERIERIDEVEEPIHKPEIPIEANVLPPEDTHPDTTLLQDMNLSKENLMEIDQSVDESEMLTQNIDTLSQAVCDTEKIMSHPQKKRIERIDQVEEPIHKPEIPIEANVLPPEKTHPDTTLLQDMNLSKDNLMEIDQSVDESEMLTQNIDTLSQAVCDTDEIMSHPQKERIERIDEVEEPIHKPEIPIEANVLPPEDTHPDTTLLQDMNLSKDNLMQIEQSVDESEMLTQNIDTLLQAICDTEEIMSHPQKERIERIDEVEEPIHNPEIPIEANVLPPEDTHPDTTLLQDINLSKDNLMQIEQSVDESEMLTQNIDTLSQAICDTEEIMSHPQKERIERIDEVEEPIHNPEIPIEANVLPPEDTHPDTTLLQDINLSKDNLMQIEQSVDESEMLTQNIDTLSQAICDTEEIMSHPQKERIERIDEVEEPIHNPEIPIEANVLPPEDTHPDTTLLQDMNLSKDNLMQIEQSVDESEMLTQNIDTLSQAICDTPNIQRSIRESQKNKQTAEEIAVPIVEPEIDLTLQKDKDADNENVSENMQDLEMPQARPSRQAEIRITTMLEEAGLTDIQAYPPEEPVTSQRNSSRRQGYASSETSLGSLDKTKVLLGDPEQMTDSLRFIRDQWGTEGTMVKILKLMRDGIKPITVWELTSKGPVITGYRSIIAALCFTSILKLKQHGFIIIKKCPETLEIKDIMLGSKFD